MISNKSKDFLSGLTKKRDSVSGYIGRVKEAKTIDDLLNEIHSGNKDLDKKDHPEVKAYLNERCSSILSESLTIVGEKNTNNFSKLFFTHMSSIHKIFEN